MFMLFKVTCTYNAIPKDYPLYPNRGQPIIVR